MTGNTPLEITEKIQIQKIEKYDEVTYLYGKFNNKKIRIATMPDEIFEKGMSYQFHLISYKYLLTESNMRAGNANIVRDKKFERRYKRDHPESLTVDYKKYKDLFLTNKMASKVIDNINESPLRKNLDKKEILKTEY